MKRIALGLLVATAAMGGLSIHQAQVYAGQASVAADQKVTVALTKADTVAKRATANCVMIAANRAEGNKRADVLRGFLTTAAQGRLKSAIAEASTDPAQSLLDKTLSDQYLAYVKMVDTLPVPDCS